MALVGLAGAGGCAPSAAACCTSDLDCAVGTRCFEGSCTPRCSDDSQCLEGERCLQSTCMAPLRAPSRCPFLERRAPHPREPADGGPVVVDAGSGGRDAGPTEPTCEDAFEPNETRHAATPLVPGLYEARICPAGDHDWYRVRVPPGAIDLSVIVVFDPDAGDLDVEIVDEGGSRVAVSQLTGGREEIRLPVHTDGAPRDLFVHIYGFGRAINAYSLELAFLSSNAVCVDDAFEDNDTEATATPLATGVLLSAAFCSGDADVLRAVLEQPAHGYGVLSYERGDELTLEVRADEQLLGRSSTFSGLELVPFSLDERGGVYLHVAGTHTQSQARPYQVGLWAVDGSCGDDAFEPNDLPAQAQPFAVLAGAGFSAVEGRLCERDVDVWRMSWRPGTSSLELTLDAPEGTRGYIVRAADLSLIARLSPAQGAHVSPGTTVVSDQTLVLLFGQGEDEPYLLRGRATFSE